MTEADGAVRPHFCSIGTAAGKELREFAEQAHFDWRSTPVEHADNPAQQFLMLSGFQKYLTQIESTRGTRLLGQLWARVQQLANYVCGALS